MQDFTPLFPVITYVVIVTKYHAPSVVATPPDVKQRIDNNSCTSLRWLRVASPHSGLSLERDFCVL